MGIRPVNEHEAILAQLTLGVDKDGKCFVEVASHTPAILRKTLDDWDPNYQETHPLVNLSAHANKLLEEVVEELEEYAR